MCYALFYGSQEFFKNRISPSWVNGSRKRASKIVLEGVINMQVMYHCLRSIKSDLLKPKIYPGEGGTPYNGP